MAEYQKHSKAQGDLGELLAREALERAGFKDIRGPVELPGVQVDLIAEAKSGHDVYFSVKWSQRGSRPGLKRTDTLRKAIAEAYLIRQNGKHPVVVLTSHLPTKGVGKEALDLAVGDVIDNAILVDDKQKLKDLFLAKYPKP